MKTYRPGLVADADLRREITAIERAAHAADPFLEIQTLQSEPVRVRAGMLAVADGANWEPGSGEGLYRRNAANTAWVFVGSGGIDGPSFSAYLSSNTAFTGNVGVFQKIVHNTEEWDLGTCYDTTNARWTPNIPGIYRISANMFLQSPAQNTDPVGLSIHKNGATHKRGIQTSISSYSFNVTALVSMNGTTDYVENFLTTNANITIFGAASLTYFQGEYVRANT